MLRLTYDSGIGYTLTPVTVERSHLYHASTSALQEALNHRGSTAFEIEDIATVIANVTCDLNPPKESRISVEDYGDTYATDYRIHYSHTRTSINVVRVSFHSLSLISRASIANDLINFVVDTLADTVPFDFCYAHPQAGDITVTLVHNCHHSIEYKNNIPVAANFWLTWELE